MNRDTILKTIILIGSIVIIIFIWFVLSDFDDKSSTVDKLKKENKKQSELIDRLELLNKEQSKKHKEDNEEIIKDHANLFIKTVFTIKEDNYDKRKSDAETILNQKLMKQLFAPEKLEEIKYEYKPNNINVYSDIKEDDANVFITFNKTVTNTDNKVDAKTFVILELFMEKQSDNWIITDFKQIHEEPK